MPTIFPIPIKKAPLFDIQFYMAQFFYLKIPTIALKEYPE